MSKMIPQRQDLLKVVRDLIEYNRLRRIHGEDTLGVLIKCGAFHYVDVEWVAREVDKL